MTEVEHDTAHGSPAAADEVVDRCTAPEEGNARQTGRDPLAADEVRSVAVPMNRPMRARSR